MTRHVPSATLDGQEDSFAALIEEVRQRFYRGRHRDVVFELVMACRTRSRSGAAAEAGLRRSDRKLPRRMGLATPDATGGGDLLTLTLFVLRGMVMHEMLAESVDGQAALRSLETGITRDFLQARHELPPGVGTAGPLLGDVA